MEPAGSESNMAQKVIAEYVKFRGKRKQPANKHLGKAFDKRDLKRKALEARRPDYEKLVKHYKSKPDAKRRARDKVIELASKDIDAPIKKSLFYELFPSRKKK